MRFFQLCPFTPSSHSASHEVATRQLRGHPHQLLSSRRDMILVMACSAHPETNKPGADVLPN